MSRSCLVAKLSHYVPLTGQERAFLAEVERQTVSYQRGETVAHAGEDLTELYVLKAGWLLAQTSDSQGSVMVAELYHPGDIVGVSQLGCVGSSLTYLAATKAELCTLPVSALPRMFKDFPRLIALFFAFASLERATLLDRLRAMGHMSARDCIALFFLQTHARLSITDAIDPVSGAFAMPLSQEMIGNAVGLSTVSVNRAIRLLEAQGHLVRDGRQMALARREDLAREVEFVDRLYRIDSSWFPKQAGDQDASAPILESPPSQA